jgi:hypothetical protein
LKCARLRRPLLRRERAPCGRASRLIPGPGHATPPPPSSFCIRLLAGTLVRPLHRTPPHATIVGIDIDIPLQRGGALYRQLKLRALRRTFVAHRPVRCGAPAFARGCCGVWSGRRRCRTLRGHYQFCRHAGHYGGVCLTHCYARATAGRRGGARRVLLAGEYSVGNTSLESRTKRRVFCFPLLDNIALDIC